MKYDEIGIRRSYETDSKNSILNEFFIPVLKCTTKYDRAVGYFNSKSFINIVDGLEGFIKNNGRMRLLVSPQLEEDDIKAIKKGYELNEILRTSIVKSLQGMATSLSKYNNLELLEKLVANGVIDIKVVFTKTYGIYHEKIGVMESYSEERLAFTGSLNETYAAQKLNYESIDVYRSWILSENERIIEKADKFERLWGNHDENLRVYDFPDVIIRDLINNANKYELLLEEAFPQREVKNDGPQKPDFSPQFNFEYRDYQLEAISAWNKNQHQGLMAMATGTGKTLTAIGALVSLWQTMEEPLFLLVVCPYTHLVEQWEDDFLKSNVCPIKAYSSYNWKDSVKDSIRMLNYGFSKFQCVITTNGTFTSDNMQTILNRIEVKRMIIVDEVHNFGSKKIRNFHDQKYDYRLALSATYQRYFDDEGTESILKYFGKVVYELDLGKAIEMGALIKYYYHPIVTSLTDNEYEDYKVITNKIRKLFASSDGEGNDALTSLLIKRSRILNLAENKLYEFEKLMKNRSETYNNLIYCAAGTMKSGERQIDEVTEIVGNKFNMHMHKFTSDESSFDRSKIIDDFIGKRIQGIVAIKCLDEGVNIPSIETAYILASSGNEKEFIQRRGRVLRKSEGKRFAHIYDLVVIPRPIEMIKQLPDNEKEVDKSIIKKELRRMREFVDLAINSHEGDRVITELEYEYKIIY
jgi:superfamily II DNA or RNA helicase